MAQSYLRYSLKTTFGVIYSPTGNVIYDRSGKLALCPALENVVVWNVRQGVKVAQFEGGEQSNATCLAASPDGTNLAVGYADGSVRLLNITKNSLLVTLNGHSAAVTCLRFSEDGTQLASGAADTDVILWDLIGQTGLFRLRGHKDAVTDLVFLSQRKLIISVSKDTLMKVWDLQTQHCVQTCVGHRCEIWTLDYDESRRRLLSGSSDNVLRLWELRGDDQAKKEGGEEEEGGEYVVPLGSIMKTGSNDRTTLIRFHESRPLIGVLSIGKVLEIYRFRTDAEIKKKIQRRQKRAREKQRGKDGEVEFNGKAESQEAESEPTGPQAQDEMELVTQLRLTHKIRSFAFSPDVAKDGSTSVLLGLHNNSLEVYRIPGAAGEETAEKETETQRLHTLSLPGHRSDVRFVSISSNGELILSVSTGEVKLWNAHNQQCVRTLATSLALVAVFVPGDRHVLVGTKNGLIQVFDLGSGELSASYEAHSGAVWSIAKRPDGRGIASGSADQDVKFWDFEMIEDEQTNKRVLGLVHTRTLKMADDVLSVCYSHSSPTSSSSSPLLLAVSLLDCTVKVFYEDSLKFFLSLYGHKLPVMAMAISSDNQLLATASADKNVKLWGLDFGDCHKSIFAHDDSVMAISFVPGTHHFFTASKDHSVKYWDGDTYDEILKLDGHKGEVWSLAVSELGDYVVSSSHDRSLRIWERSPDGELVFIEEERERKLEEMFEKDAAAPEKGKLAGEEGESAKASLQSLETLKAGERLLEAIQMAVDEQKRFQAYSAQKKGSTGEDGTKEDHGTDQAGEGFVPNVLLLGHSPSEYILYTLRQIRAQDIEEALLLLPYSAVQAICSLLLQLLQSESVTGVEVCAKVTLAIVKIHQQQIVGDNSLLPVLTSLWKLTREKLRQQQDTIGYNIAGLKFLKTQLASEQNVYVEDQDSRSKEASRKRQKITA